MLVVPLKWLNIDFLIRITTNIYLRYLFLFCILNFIAFGQRN